MIEENDNLLIAGEFSKGTQPDFKGLCALTSAVMAARCSLRACAALTTQNMVQLVYRSFRKVRQLPLYWKEWLELGSPRSSP